MAFEYGTEHLPCRDCGAQHALKWSRMPLREHVAIKCLACGGVVFDGKTLRDYDGARLIDTA